MYEGEIELIYRAYLSPSIRQSGKATSLNAYATHNLSQALFEFDTFFSRILRVLMACVHKIIPLALSGGSYHLADRQGYCPVLVKPNPETVESHSKL